MKKPFVVCHMFTSMDGKIDGAFMTDPAAVAARTEYGNLRGFYQCQATVYGTVTMAGGFADGWAGQIPSSGASYPREDWVAPSDVQNYIVSVDPLGKLGWSSAYIEKKGRLRAHVIEVLTEQVSEDYIAYLRGFGISYLFVGEKQLDCALLLHKLQSLFGIEKVMLAGGGYMNGSFLQEDLIDEVSLVIAPVVDGNTTSVTSFERSDFLPDRKPAAFRLLEAKPLEDGGLWLRYAQKK